MVGVVAIVFGLSVRATGERVIACPVSAQDVETYALDGLGIVPSPGLLSVGLGESIHLEAQVAADDVVTAPVVWTLTERPAGSAAVIQASVLPADVPIYDPADAQTMQIAGRALLVPDVEGLYFITATITTAAGGSVDVEVVASGGNYVGVGDHDALLGSPLTPHCAECHTLDKRVQAWKETKHASMFQRKISGESTPGEEYELECIQCHTVGYNPTPGAVNGGFDDVATELGWTFPGSLDPSNWDTMPDALKMVSNIQCENCHGAGSAHSGDARAISVSYNVGDCAICHDIRAPEWKTSPHARVPYRVGGSCAPCHNGDGFIAATEGDSIRPGMEHTIGCAACHDPHSAANEHQVRTTEDVTLSNGEIATEGGNGKLCMHCHISRRNSAEYVLENHSHYGPHHGPQTDMLLGTNAIQYGNYIPSASAHLLTVDQACVGCHMQELESDNPALDGEISHAGSHTFEMVWDGGTPDDPSDDVDQTGVCATCHGEQDDFDVLTLKDYDGDGVAEGVQTEIDDLMETLAKLLPPLQLNQVDDPTDAYTQAQRSAVYNYRFVLEDGSHGVHNAPYASGILKASIADLQGAGTEVGPLGGTPDGSGWIYSDWFGWYSPIFDGKWIFHQYHGPLYVVAGTGDMINLWDPVINDWLLTSPDLYPTMLMWGRQKWVTFTPGTGGTRVFTDTTTGEILTYPGFSFEPPNIAPGN
ncbi:MAG: hypothetical protein GXP31_13520 [Kiritimatiellaeota bacterium]|nr:hypothetical protein [Kiritimatiellota bacterium]